MTILADNIIMNSMLPMNLGFFNNPAQEKTEKATPRKREKAREEGQVAQSQEVGTAVLLIAAFVSLRAFVPGMLTRLLNVMRMHLMEIGSAPDHLHVDTMARWIWTMFGQIVLILHCRLLAL